MKTVEKVGIHVAAERASCVDMNEVQVCWGLIVSKLVGFCICDGLADKMMDEFVGFEV